MTSVKIKEGQKTRPSWTEVSDGDYVRLEGTECPYRVHVNSLEKGMLSLFPVYAGFGYFSYRSINDLPNLKSIIKKVTITIED